MMSAISQANYSFIPQEFRDRAKNVISNPQKIAKMCCEIQEFSDALEEVNMFCIFAANSLQQNQEPGVLELALIINYQELVDKLDEKDRREFHEHMHEIFFLRQARVLFQLMELSV